MRTIIICFAVILAIFSQALADDGVPDTLLLLPSIPEVGANDSLFTLELWCFNDADGIQVQMGFEWESDLLTLDSVLPSALADGIFSEFYFYENNDIAVSNANSRALFAGLNLTGNTIDPSSERQHLATYYFSLSSWSMQDSIVVDSAQWNEGTEMLFAYQSGSYWYSYTPVWLWGDQKHVIHNPCWGPDTDSDSWPDGCDNCPSVYNPDQADSDADGVGDSCDICAGFDDSADADSDGVPDGCDLCAGFDDNLDTDSDAVPNGCDNCPTVYNPDQVDSDADGVGDSCDICVGFDDSADADSDGVPDGCDLCAGFNDNIDTDSDSVPNGCDNCPTVYNPDQADSNGNEIGDACEFCCGEYTGGQTGNTDCDTEGKRNLSDITRLIDRVYISKMELCCPENGNTDGDAEAKINLADITRLVDHVYLSKTETAACE